MYIVKHSNRCRIKLTKMFYINIYFIWFIPIISIQRDSRGIDAFFEYLISDAMWDEV